MIKTICLLCIIPLLNAQLAETTEPSYWRFAHRDAQLVAGLNWKASQQGTAPDSVWRAMGATLGHVERFFITSSSTVERYKEPGQALIIVSGQFDLALMKKAAAIDGVVATTFKGVTLLGPAKIEGDSIFIACVDPTVALVGTKTVISEALDRGEQPRNGPLSEKNELFGTAMDMSGLNDLYVVTNVSDTNREDSKNPMSSLNAYAAGYNLADGVQLSMHINATTEEKAREASKRLGAILNQMNVHFPGILPVKPGLATSVFLSNMKMATEESDLHAWSQVNSAQLLALRKKDNSIVAGVKAPPALDLEKPAMQQPRPRKESKPQSKTLAATSTPGFLATPFVVAPISTPPPIKRKIVRIEGLDDGLREIPYGGASLD